MTTIRECMKRRQKRVNLFGICGWTVAVSQFVAAPQAHVSLIACVVWVALVTVVTLAGMFLLSLRIRCPNCKGSLPKGDIDNLAACPNCQTSMDAPYP
jgi:hypothetical protein